METIILLIISERARKCKSMRYELPSHRFRSVELRAMGENGISMISESRAHIVIDTSLRTEGIKKKYCLRRTDTERIQ